MSLGTVALLAVLTSHAQSLGVFERVIGHEPHNSPGAGSSAAFWAGPVTPTSSGLASTSALVVFTARLYVPATAPDDASEVAILTLVDKLCGAYNGDFTLGGTVRCVDLAGMSGTALSAALGWVTMEGQQYRIADVTIPVIVNDLWGQSE